MEAEDHCRNQMRLLIDQIGMNQENIVTLEGILYYIFHCDVSFLYAVSFINCYVVLFA